MVYEIDFHPTGSGDCNGDAITIRYGDFRRNGGEQRVIVIDGGYKETGEKLVEHIRNVYKTHTIDLIISTHPHQDHIGGLTPIIEQLDVLELWMHLPQAHSAVVRQILEAVRNRDRLAMDKIEESLAGADDLERLARRRGIPILEPFAGDTYENVLHVIGPTKHYYEELMECSAERQLLVGFPGRSTKPARARRPSLLTAGLRRSWRILIITRSRL